MSEAIRSILGAVSARVLSYRPAGEAPAPLAKTTRRCNSCGAKADYACSPDCPDPR